MHMLRDLRALFFAVSLSLFGCGSVPDDCVRLAFVHENPEGKDKDRLNDEYLALANTCSYPIGMGGWSVEDAAEHQYIFPSAVIPKFGVFYVHSGKGVDAPPRFFWNSSLPIWNNDTDTLYLRNEQGRLLQEYTYGVR